MTKDEKDIRGRWKGAGRVSDVYDDVELPYPDAKVAEKLCGGGPCFYVLDPGLDATMMNTFVLSRVIPNIRKRLPESTCLVLGKALLWLICSPVADEYVPSEFKREVLLEWEHVRGADVDPTLNPIKQMAVTVSSDHGAVFIDMLGTIDVDGVAGQPAPGTNVTMQNALQPSSRRTARGGRDDAVEDTAEVPGRAAANDPAMMATLMPTPRSLHDLWQEYHHGVGGRKPLNFSPTLSEVARSIGTADAR